MTTRIEWAKHAPEAYKAMIGLEQAMVKSGLEHSLLELIRLRASQINGCAYCLRLHTKDALKLGETTERLALLPAWRESDYFTAVERAALSLTEAITNVSDRQVPDDVYVPAAQVLSEEQISAVSWLAIIMNSYNRVAITSRYNVKP